MSLPPRLAKDTQWALGKHPLLLQLVPFSRQGPSATLQETQSCPRALRMSPQRGRGQDTQVSSSAADSFKSAFETQARKGPPGWGLG